MEQESKFLKSLVEVAHIEFQSYDFHRNAIIFSNGMGCKVLGYSKEEFDTLSRNFYGELIHPDDMQKMQESINKIIQSKQGEIVEMTARYRRADGNYIWIYTRKMVSERDKKGDPSTITTVAEDITDLIGLQDQLKEKTEQLQAISYRNSHMLRSPVASIIGLINLIEEKDITSAHNIEIFGYLKQTIAKLDSVIHEINELSG